MKRILTYDVKTGNKYDDLYKWLEEISAKKLTESTYETITNLNQGEYKNKIKSLINKGDNVFYISVSNDKEIFSSKIKI